MTDIVDIGIGQARRWIDVLHVLICVTHKVYVLVWSNGKRGYVGIGGSRLVRNRSVSYAILSPSDKARHGGRATNYCTKLIILFLF